MGKAADLPRAMSLACRAKGIHNAIGTCRSWNNICISHVFRVLPCLGFLLLSALEGLDMELTLHKTAVIAFNAYLFF